MQADRRPPLQAEPRDHVPDNSRVRSIHGDRGGQRLGTSSIAINDYSNAQK